MDSFIEQRHESADQSGKKTAAGRRGIRQGNDSSRARLRTSDPALRQFNPILRHLSPGLTFFRSTVALHIHMHTCDFPINGASSLMCSLGDLTLYIRI